MAPLLLEDKCHLLPIMEREIERARERERERERDS
jgi:hypothetical protein